MPWVEKVLTHLSDGGHRVTEPRRLILDRIAQYQQPFSAEQLFRDVAGENGSIGRATVYRTVELLHDGHWLARVHWNAAHDGAIADEHAYVPVEQGHQHHLICKRCGSVVAFEGCDIDGILGGLTRRLNFRVEDHWLEVYGLCQVCQRQS